MNDMSKLIKHVREAPNFFILLVSFLCIALCLLVSGLVIFTKSTAVFCNSSTSHICPL